MDALVAPLRREGPGRLLTPLPIDWLARVVTFSVPFRTGRKEMTMFKRQVIALAFVSIACIGAVLADPTTQEWSGQIAIGYAFPMGRPGDYLNGGWNLQGGATWRPASGPFGVRFDLAGNFFHAKNSAIGGFLQGNARVWSLTADAVYDFGTSGAMGFYIMGGVGGYREYANLTVPTYVPGYWCDPWGWCYAGYPSQAVVWDKAVYAVGYNLGAAITFKMQNGMQIYFEATYHMIQTSTTTEYMPFVVGWRF